MTPDDAATTFIEEVRDIIRRQVGVSHHFLTTGEPEVLRDPATGSPAKNPFTGEPMLLEPLPEVRRLQALLQARGLGKDKELMDTLRAVLLDTASAPMFSLLAALDGEGAFLNRELQLELRVVNGDPLPTHLHEILYPIEPG